MSVMLYTILGIIAAQALATLIFILPSLLPEHGRNGGSFKEEIFFHNLAFGPSVIRDDLRRILNKGEPP